MATPDTSKHEGISADSIHDTCFLELANRLAHLDEFMVRVNVVVRLARSRRVRSSTGSNDAADWDVDLAFEMTKLLGGGSKSAYGGGALSAEEKTLCTKVGCSESVVEAIDCDLKRDLSWVFSWHRRHRGSIEMVG